MKTNCLITKNDENLSEEILSERASKKTIKTTEKMNKKMKMSAFNKFKSGQTVRNIASKPLQLTRQFKSCRDKEVIEERSFFSRTSKKISKLDDSFESRLEKQCRSREGSLSNQIRGLLRVTAEIRRKKSELATSQVHPSEISVDDIERISSFSESSESNRLDEESLYTFGE